MDEALLVWINNRWSDPVLDDLLGWASARWTFSFPLLLVLLWDSVRRAGRRGVQLWLVLVVSIAVGDATGNAIKGWTNQPRPCYSHHRVLVAPGGGPMDRCGGASATGMPSNHALNFSLAAAFMVVATGWRPWHVALVAAAVLASLSRVYLGKHFPSQVAAGVVLGTALGILAGLWACYHRACLRDPRAGDNS